MGALLDCAELCGLQQELILRASPLGADAASLCRAACERCATECEGMLEDQQMQACARECRRCAEACAALAGAGAVGR